jgi:hypothetical protein
MKKKNFNSEFSLNPTKLDSGFWNEISKIISELLEMF